MRIFGSAVILAIVACAELPRFEPSLVERDWDRAQAETRRNVEAGNYHAADRILAEFARVHPGSREAREVAFWRAAYLIDPANALGSLEGGIAALDAYLASEPQGWYRREADVLRRTALAAQGLAVGASTGWRPPPDTIVVVTQDSVARPPRRSRDEELAALRDQLARSKSELAKANAELERIKQRLANPTP